MSTQPTATSRRIWWISSLLARLLVGGLFVVAALSKIEDPQLFIEEIRAYELVPIQVTNAPAFLLPWLELFAAILLIVGVWRRESRFIILVMLAGFTVAKVVVLAQGREIDCGCFGDIDFLTRTFAGAWGILLNVVLLGLLAVDYLAQRRFCKPVPETPATPSGPLP